MKTKTLSRPLFAALVFSSVLCSVVLLEPEPLPPTDDELLNVQPGNEKEADRVRAEPTRVLQTYVPGHTGSLLAQVTVAPPVVSMPQPEQVTTVSRPMAPNPDFRYLGRMVDGTKVQVFLAQNENSRVVTQGETLDGRWLIKVVEDDHVDVVYLPLNEVRRLNIDE